MATSEFVTLQAERLTDTIYELLRDRILSGVYAPGERLPVDQIARQLGVSQTPVKGALGLLVSEDLVRTSPRRGTFVTEIDERTLVESLAIRAALEQLAAETLLLHVTAVDIERLNDLVRRIQTATEVGEHFRLNLEFHEVLVNLSGNLRLAEIYRQLKAHIQMALIHSRSENWTGRMVTENEEHLAILAAIEANDRDALKIAIDAHLTHARASLLGQLRMQGG
jgi:DNA-binding GntR family transcriptional regulator